MSDVTVAKAVHLVNNGNVKVDLWHIDNEGVIDVASGHVQSGTNTYWVTLTPEGATCSCEWGRHHHHPSQDFHSHDLALRLAAQQEATE